MESQSSFPKFPSQRPPLFLGSLYSPRAILCKYKHQQHIYVLYIYLQHTTDVFTLLHDLRIILYQYVLICFIFINYNQPQHYHFSFFFFSKYCFIGGGNLLLTPKSFNYPKGTRSLCWQLQSITIFCVFNAKKYWEVCQLHYVKCVPAVDFPEQLKHQVYWSKEDTALFADELGKQC